ncbi:queuosine precursor transporter [candidate division WOR-3 bacterium]|nr:queuosine precursor transporter [candidate division WOR-3 bacterium]
MGKKNQDIGKQFQYYDIVMAAFVTVLLVSNIASAARIVQFTPIILDLGRLLSPFKFILGEVATVPRILEINWFPWPLDAGTFLFPLAYIFGDILTEVYGYARARRVIWIGFGANALMSGIIMLVGLIPAAPFGPSAHAYSEVLGLTPRIVGASLLAYWAGEFSNSFTLAKMKVWTKGRFLWARTIGSTLVGQCVDTAVFVFAAFLGARGFAITDIVGILIGNYIWKVGTEVLFTPVTYLVVGGLKRAECVDHYDRKTNFNPFHVFIPRKMTASFRGDP